MTAEGGGEGEFARLVVGRARAALEAAVGGGRAASASAPRPGEEGFPAFAQPRGVFVTLKSFPADRLRGCIGFPLPHYPLGRAISLATAAAAREDPRFPPVRPAELPAIVLSVSVLSRPEPLPGPAARRAEEVVVGRDGLIVETAADYGLLLPQVAPEQGWNAVEFLRGTCEKAGVDPEAWSDPATRVLRFTATVYEETRPGGPVAVEAPSPAGDRGRARA